MTELASEPRGWFEAKPMIVTMGNAPRLDMLQEARAVLPRHLLRRNSVKLVFRHGLVSSAPFFALLSILRPPRWLTLPLPTFSRMRLRT
jgi:hypothetical protein